jgi:membrane-associated phospholipid phosphatase
MVAAPSRDVWKTYGVWAFAVGVVFFSVYPTCNWLTSQRTPVFSLYLESELNVPFVPEFVWVYLSMYVLFLTPLFALDVSRLKALGKQLVASTLFSGVVFLLLPAKLGFTRAAPKDPFYGSLFADMFAVDLPYNMVPSLHVVFSALFLFALLDASSTLLAKSFLWVWLILMCTSTLLVHQHHLLDVITGLAVALLARRWMRNGGVYA